jgi:hypothetical protein
MQSHILAAAAVAVSATFALGAPALSADLPQQGSFTAHSGGKANDAGSGPLHKGSAVCTVSGDNVNGSFNDGGFCAFGDAGGADKFFVAWSGKGTEGVGEQGGGTITGGTGKYDGIQGKGTYQCKFIDFAQGLLDCTHKFDYQLKAAAATR